MAGLSTVPGLLPANVTPFSQPSLIYLEIYHITTAFGVCFSKIYCQQKWKGFLAGARQQEFVHRLYRNMNQFWTNWFLRVWLILVYHSISKKKHSLLKVDLQKIFGKKYEDMMVLEAPLPFWKGHPRPAPGFLSLPWVPDMRVESTNPPLPRGRCWNLRAGFLFEVFFGLFQR